MSSGIALLLLAAGGSTRLGRPKQLQPFRGTTLLRHAAETALATPCRPVIAVLGALAAEMAAELADLEVVAVENPGWREGMSSSVRAGMSRLARIAPETRAVMVTLCDQPLVEAGDLAALLAAGERTQGLAAARHGSGLGVPAFFPRLFFPELQALSGEAGARQLLARHRDAVEPVAMPHAGFDVDTVADCEALDRLASR